MCTVVNCARPTIARGLCAFHYKRLRFGRELDAPKRPPAILPKHHPFYMAWVNMKTRCDNPNSTQYKYYGGRGIGYCERWKSFACFYEDMFETWHHELELDRRDTNASYSPENCRWVTHKEQCLNRNPRGYLAS